MTVCILHVDVLDQFCCQLGQFSRVFRCQLLELFSSVHVSVCPLHVDVLVQFLLSFGTIF